MIAIPHLDALHESDDWQCSQFTAAFQRWFLNLPDADQARMAQEWLEFVPDFAKSEPLTGIERMLEEEAELSRGVVLMRARA